jgi:hypothetical protein
MDVRKERRNGYGKIFKGWKRLKAILLNPVSAALSNINCNTVDL